MMDDIVNFGSKEFIEICKSHNVKVLYAFGSVVNGNFTDKSDMDLLVEIDEPDPLTRGELLFSIRDNLNATSNEKLTYSPIIP